MNNFKTIYKFELKKILNRKFTWIISILCILSVFISVFSNLIGTYYVDGIPVESNYESIIKDNEYRKELSGRKIDNILIQETIETYKLIPQNNTRYTLTEEYEKYARAYSDIFNLIRSYTGMNFSDIQEWEASETALYHLRANKLENNWDSIFLSEKEKAFWRDKEEQIEKPLVYYYHEGYDILLNAFLTIGVLMILLVSISLSNLFADEHTKRTDQIMLSTINGKETTYWAKIFAGITFACVSAITITLLTMLLSFCFYGTEGFTMPIQVCIGGFSYPISIGEACIILYSVLIITSILIAVFVMVMSEIFKSSIISLSISTTLLILANVVMIPSEFRILAQIWDWSPMVYLSTWNILDARLLTIFKYSFTSWQIVPLIYLCIAVIISIIGKHVYLNYQISGR